MKLLGLEKTSLLTRKSINRSRLRSGLFLAALALAYPALSPITQAVTPTGWRLSRSKHRNGRLCPLQPHNWHPKHSHWFSRRSIPTQPAAKTPPLVFFALQDNITGKNNIALGYAAGIFTAGDNNINIGNVGAEESDTIRIGTVNGRGIRDFKGTPISPASVG